MLSLISPRKGVVELTRSATPKGALRILYSVISPGTERAFVMGAAENAVWPYRPGYSACAQDANGRLWAVRALHASHWKPGKDEWMTPVPRGVTPQAAAMATLGQVAIQAIRRVEAFDGEPIDVVGGGFIARTIRAVGIAMGHPVMTWPCGPNSVSKISNRNRIIEASGLPDGFRIAAEGVAKRGTIVIAGSHRFDVEFNAYAFHKTQARIVGAWANGDSPSEKRADEEGFLRLVAAGKVGLLSSFNRVGYIRPSVLLASYRAMLDRTVESNSPLLIAWQRGAIVR